MTRRPSISEKLAMKAAAAIADVEDEPPPVVAVAAQIAHIEPETVDAKQGRGRPKGKRAIEARQTVYLDAARHAALVRIAEDRGRSVHSLILEGIDHVIGKPSAPGWQ